MSRTVGLLDATVVAAGATLLAAGFLPWWQVGSSGDLTVAGGGRTAWDGSVAWWLPVLAGAVTAGLWLLWRLGELPGRWLPGVTALVATVGLALVAGRAATLPAGGGDFGWYAYSPVTDAGDLVPTGTPGPGLWLAAAALLAQLVAAVITLRRRGAGTDRTM